MPGGQRAFRTNWTPTPDSLTFGARLADPVLYPGVGLGTHGGPQSIWRRWPVMITTEETYSTSPAVLHSHKLIHPSYDASNPFIKFREAIVIRQNFVRKITKWLPTWSIILMKGPILVNIVRKLSRFHKIWSCTQESTQGKAIQLQKVWQMQTRVIQNALEIPGEYL